MLTAMDTGANHDPHGESDYLRDRYGISQKRRRPWVLPALLLLIFGGGWLIWSADFYSKPEVSSDLISFTTSNPRAVTLRYFVNVRTASKSHQCVLIASDFDGNVVGEITDTIPAGAHNYNRIVQIPVRTPAASAAIEHCS